MDKLKSIGLKEISWHGTCEANRVTTGRWDVPQGEGGMYGLVFDNTFSKQLSKSVTFVLLTFPTSSFPPINHQIQGRPPMNGERQENRRRRMKLGPRDSSDSLAQLGSLSSDTKDRQNGSKQQDSAPSAKSNGTNFFTGVLQKRRRKRHQGYARRFFSLDFSTATLSYYHNQNTRAIRGAIPLSLAAIGANGKTRDISIDSGAEIWHLRASNAKDFEAWKNALELARAPHSPASPVIDGKPDPNNKTFPSSMQVNVEEEREWAKVESLVNQIQKSRETARLLAKEMDPRYLPLGLPKPPFERKSTASSASESPSEQSLVQTASGEGDRRPFWKRKPSNDRSTSRISKRSTSAQSSPMPFQNTSTAPGEASSSTPTNGKSLAIHDEQSLHDQCLTLLQNLDSITTGFTVLLQNRKQRRAPVRPMPVSTVSRNSLETLGESQEFYDAEAGESSQFLAIQHETDEGEGGSEQPEASDADSASEPDQSESEDQEQDPPKESSTSAYPPKPNSLSPLPAQRVQRRTTVPSPTVAAPSLISFLRKNVGKDLSTIAMPASSNEPLSLLQRASEQLEYSQLLDSAASDTSESSTRRLLYITAFAISTLSYARVKERAIRKPFNPMLGETFELVREDRGFRFIAEKVCHRPVRMACQAESEKWSFVQSPIPSQKFWGKSAELVTEGKVRIILHPTGDRFVWTPATSFLRNIIAGEKYVEPVGGMTVTNEANGEHAIVTFKSKGMFSGRSEDVDIVTKDSFGDDVALGLQGKWTSSLSITENGTPKSNEQPIWKVEELPADVNKHYGFTAFAASLNEITGIEKGKLPPTDSRLRPDQRLVEENKFEEAERVKSRLEEAQRGRRREQEGGKEWCPRWFRKVEGADGGEEVWRLREGVEGYWEKRGRGAWGGGDRVFDV